MTQPDLPHIAHLCQRMRRDIIEMVGAAGSGHPGGSLSAVEIVATLYSSVMKHDPADPKAPDRDRFV
ncbi:MAG TPA: transketolase, partial [Coriobacteriia bacterium]